MLRGAMINATLKSKFDMLYHVKYWSIYPQRCLNRIDIPSSDIHNDADTSQGTLKHHESLDITVCAVQT